MLEYDKIAKASQGQSINKEDLKEKLNSLDIPELTLLVVVVAMTRYISMGSIVAAALFPFAVWLLMHPHPAVIASAVASGAFIVWRHRANIERIRNGTENVFRFKGKRS